MSRGRQSSRKTAARKERRKTKALEGAPAASGGPSRRRRLKRPLILAAVIGALLLAAFAALQLRARSGAPHAVLPDPDLSGAEAQVAARIRTLRSAAEENPRSHEAWGRLGMALHIHGFEREAVTCYEQAAAFEPQDFRWPYYAAIALRDIGSPDAIDWFRRALALRPGYAPLQLRYGRALFDAGQLDEAARALQQSLEADPTLANAYVELARIELARDEVAGSRGHLERALEINPRDGSAHGLLAEVSRRLGDTATANRERRIAEQLPEQATFYDSLYADLSREGVSSRWHLVRGQALLDGGRADLAVSEFRSALRAREDADAHNDLGIALQYLGRFDEAIEHHRAALAIRPRFPEALINLGSALFEMGDVEQGIARVEEARRLDPTLAQAYLSLGIFHGRAGRLAAAVSALRQGMENAPYDIRIANRLAWLLATSDDAAVRDGAEAVRLAEAVCEMTGYRVAEALDVLAAAYAETGQFTRARETARRAYGLAVAARRNDLAERIQVRAELYEAGQPYRDVQRRAGE